MSERVLWTSRNDPLVYQQIFQHSMNKASETQKSWSYGKQAGMALILKLAFT